MSKVIVQVPADRKLRDKAVRAAYEYGFSSLQEMLRLFMNKIAKKELKVTIEDNVEYLTLHESAILERKYKEFLKEEKKGKTFEARSAEEMIRQLTS